MIIAEWYAECDGCGYRIAGKKPPEHWIHTSLGGGKERRLYCQPLCMSSEAGIPRKTASQRRARPYSLTPRDPEVIEQVAMGRLLREGANVLGITTHSFKNRLYEISKKLGSPAGNRIVLVMLAGSLGLIDLMDISTRLRRQLLGT